MTKLAILLLAFLALSQAAPSAKPLDMTKIRPMRKTRPVLATAPKPRVVGGQNAIAGQIPYQAMVVTDSNQLFGGALISSNFILTSGQAIFGHSVWTVTLGATILSSPSETWRVVQQTVTAHNNEQFLNGADIGLIQLPIYVTENVYVKRAFLPSSADIGNSFVGATARVAGFGVTSSGQVADILQYLDVAVITNSDCANLYGGASISADDICAKSAIGNACAGDNGSPLVIDLGSGISKIIGVSSFGSTTGCTPTVPGGYSRVTSYLGWISTNTGLPIN